MNQRIRELFKREYGYFPSPGELVEAEKFAELIVQECADIAKQTDTDDGDDYKSGRVWAGIDILKHFNVGVES